MGIVFEYPINFIMPCIVGGKYHWIQWLLSLSCIVQGLGDSRESGDSNSCWCWRYYISSLQGRPFSHRLLDIWHLGISRSLCFSQYFCTPHSSSYFIYSVITCSKLYLVCMGVRRGQGAFASRFREYFTKMYVLSSLFLTINGYAWTCQNDI